jgi:hypothetical protein
MKKFGRAGSTFGTVIAAVAVIAVATTGGAVAGGLVTSAKIKNNTIKSIDVKDNNLKSVDVADGSLLPQDMASDTQRRFTTINGYAVVTVDSAATADGADTFARATCPSGTMVVGGGAGWANGSAGASFLSRNTPEAYSGGASSNPTTTTANTWFAQGENHSGGSRVLRVHAICASVY